MHRLRIIFQCLLLLMFSSQASTRAQSGESTSSEILGSWRISQREALPISMSLGFEERVEIAREGPRRSIKSNATNIVERGADGRWIKSIVSIERNGIPLTDRQLAVFSRRVQPPSGLPLMLLYPIAFSQAPFEQLAPHGPPLAEDFGDIQVWKVELRPTRTVHRRPPPGRHHPRISNMLLWFTRDTPHRLLQAKITAHPDRGGSPATLTARFGDFHGLDVPLEAIHTALAAQRRRIRTYTSRSTSTARFLNYRVLDTK